MIRDYGPEDLGLQRRLLGDAATTEHLGGPETPEQIERRHRRLLALQESGEGRQFVIQAADGTSAGCVGYWARAWRDERVWETGWLLLPEWRGRGLARTGLREMLEVLDGSAPPRPVHAFPSVDNTPSNALCAGAGFVLVGPVEFEYPPGRRMTCNDWRRPPAPRGDRTEDFGFTHA